jgi:hypothetical protein
MKKIILLIFVLLIFGLNISYSQTDDIGLQYFPLRVGNAFYYKSYISGPGSCDSNFIISRITQTKMFEGNRYYYCTNVFGRNNQNYYIRYNSSTGNLVYLDTVNIDCKYEIALYNLSANVGDSVSSYCRSTQYKCNSISDSLIFNMVTKVKNFGYNNTTIGFVSSGNTNFARRIGCISDGGATFHSSGYYSAFSQYLQGCKINGIVRGDTINHITPMYADSGKYMPLAIGNKWVYYKTSYSGYHDGYQFSKVVSKIQKDTIADGKRYYYVENFAGPGISYWIRYDGNTGRLIKRTGFTLCGGDLTLYNFAYAVSDSSQKDTCSGNSYVVSTIYDTVLFGVKSRTKEYSWYSSAWHESHYWETEFIKNLGPNYYTATTSTVTGYSGELYQLTGCFINGVLYGDTSSVIPPSYTDSASYFPLAVGNKWVYLNGSSIGGPYSYGISETKITKDTVINNKRYFLINKIPFTSMTNIWIRYDSTNGHLNWLTNNSSCNNELMFYDLSDNLGDSCNSSYTPCCLSIYVCNIIKDTALFGINSRIKSYYNNYSDNNGGSSYTRHFAKNIGFLYYGGTYCGIHAQNYSYAWLKGYVINGHVFGDTVLTNANIVNTTVPDKYKLFQNYPNPFNPRTVIGYSLIKNCDVKLKVYNILGKEVVTLVNGKQSPGTYEVTFDGTQYPSGVYFYKIVAGDFSEVKKMLFVK